MTDRPLRLALVGLGTWARTGHLPVYRSARLRDRVRVVGLCSRDAGRAEAWATDIPGAEWFDDFDRMLRATAPDAVAVTTPDCHHTRFALAALDAGCHVLVEKPLATDLEDCRQILIAARRADRRVLTLYHKRADPVWAEAARQVREGGLGPLQMGWATIQNPVTVPLGGYFTTPDAGGTDANWFLGSHMYDLLRSITGCTPVSVSARAYHGVLAEHGLRVPDAIKADLLLDTGASVAVLLSWNLPGQGPSLTRQAICLHFRHGELDLDGTRRGFVHHGPDGYRYVNPYFLRDTPAGPSGYGADYLAGAIAAISNSPPVLPFALADEIDAWWASAVAAAVARSAAHGGAVTQVASPPEGGCR